ncbi:unnamed protein product [Parajaminaea phylloscopi]
MAQSMKALGALKRPQTISALDLPRSIGSTSCRGLGTASSSQTHGDQTTRPPITALRQKVQQRIADIDLASPWPAQSARPRAAHGVEPPLVPQPSLSDSFGRDHTYLRISLTERCSFRCTYCMPASGVPLTPDDRLLSSSEIKRVASLFVGMGVKKIRLTGGEPLLRSDLLDIVRHLHTLRSAGLESIGITTNGLVLGRLVNPLVEAGLTHLNISIDSLRPARFASVTRMHERAFDKVMQSIHKALHIRRQQIEAGMAKPLKVKLNVVVMKGSNEDEIKDFVDFTKEHDLEVRFIEYMPFNSNSWSTSLLTPTSSLLDALRASYPTGSIRRSFDDSNDTTRHWSVRGYKGRFGFISSMTDHFCSSCNRIRVLADGNLKVCLFGNKEVSLRDALRADHHDDRLVKSLISQAIDRKHFKHAGLADPKAIWQAAEGQSGDSEAGREMSRIGG